MPYVARSPAPADRRALEALLQSVWGPGGAVHRLGDTYPLLQLPRLVLVKSGAAPASPDAAEPVVGTAGWALLPPEFDDDGDGEWVLDLSTPPVMRGVLVDLAIVPGCRRQGAGTALLQAVLTRLRQTGIGEVLTSVSPDNEAGLAFLRRAGFRQADTGGTVTGPWPAESVLTMPLR